MIGSPFMLLINLQISRKNKKNFLNCKKKVSFIPKKLPFIAKVNFWGKNVKKEKFIKGFANVLAAVAVTVTSGVATTGCFTFLHQPELPKGAEKLRKFK